MNVEKSKEILEALVGFDTVSRNSNLELIAWVEQYLDKLGVKHERVYDDTGTKSNLWATLGRADRDGRGHWAQGQARLQGDGAWPHVSFVACAARRQRGRICGAGNFENPRHLGSLRQERRARQPL